MSKVLHVAAEDDGADDNAKAVSIPRVFCENS